MVPLADFLTFPAQSFNTCMLLCQKTEAKTHPYQLIIYIEDQEIAVVSPRDANVSLNFDNIQYKL